MKTTSSAYGYCPELDDEVEIEVTFVEVPILGASGPQYKKTSFLCDYASMNPCKTAGSSGRDCPLFKNCMNP